MKKFTSALLITTVSLAAWGAFTTGRRSASKVLTPETRETWMMSNSASGKLTGALGNTPKRAAEKNTNLKKTEYLYAYLFDTEEAFNNCTAINGNNDEFEWHSVANMGWARIYTYGITTNADDWLITPGVELEAGKYYNIYALVATADEESPERIEVKLGTAPTAEAMTISVADPVTFTTPSMFDPVEMGKYVTVPTTGTYHIGIHDINEPKAGNFGLYLTGFFVEKPVDANAPKAVENLSVEPDSEFKPIITISGKAPEKAMNGNTLSSLDAIVIERNDVEISKLSVEPGKEFSFVDELEEEGDYSYNVTTYANSQKGETVSGSAYAGVNASAMPVNIKVVELKNEQLGKVRGTWSPVTTDKTGRPLPSEFVSYDLIDNIIDDYIARNLKETEFEWVSCKETEQELCQLMVRSRTKGGKSEWAYSEHVAIGRPYDLPYEESFDKGDVSSIIAWYTFNGNVQWGLSTDDIDHDADGTNGCAGFFSQTVGGQSLLHTGKLNLVDAEHPVFTFSLYNLVENDEANLNEIEIMARNDDEEGENWITLRKGVVKDLCKNGDNEWQQITTDLSSLKGHVAYVGVRITRKNHEYAFIDAFKVYEAKSDNLTVKSFSTSKTAVHNNEETTFTVEIVNNGLQEAKDYKVELYRDDNDELVQTVDGPEIAPDNIAGVSFTHSLGFNDPEEVAFYAMIAFDADKDMSDNYSAPVTLSKIKSGMPAPLNLIAENNGNDRARLSWTSPTEGKPENQTVTEDFEAYTGFVPQIGSWTLYDGDQSPTGGFDGVTLPNGIEHSNQSFFLFDAANPAISGSKYAKSFKAYSGNKFAACLYRSDLGELNDWIISPLLSGNEQTIKLFAKSYMSDYPESFEVLCSEKGTDTADFTSIAVKTNVPASWTEYSFKLPAGTKYFAIRVNSSNNFFFQLDDVTYETKTIYPVGYNLYRNGVKVNSTPIAATTVSDDDAEEGPAVYRVTAVYESGEESEPSNEASFTNAVAMVHAGATVKVIGNNIIINGAAGKNVTVANAAGMVLYNGKAGDNLNVPASAGIYIVSIDAKACKLIVR